MENNIEIVVPQAKDYVADQNSEVDERLCGNVVISIQDMFDQLPSVNGEISNIYRVPKKLLEINNTAYIPQLISIGPFHHGTNNLIVAQQYKLQSFLNFLRRMNRSPMARSLDFLVKTSQSWVKEARNCYAELVNMNDEQFLKMLLVDGCFLVEFFLIHCEQYYPHRPDDDDDHDQNSTKISKNNVDLSFCQVRVHDIYSDLIKLENQVPFFVLQRLFDLIPKDGILASVCFIELTYCIVFFGLFGNYEVPNVLSIKPKHFVDFLTFYFLPKHDQDQSRGNKRLNPPSITELCEAGVMIKKAENSKSLTNISFKNGVLEIPPLVIHDDFEPIMRNMIAFEQFPAGNMNKKYVIQYVIFMDGLISTEKDVSLLAEAGVIINNIGGSDKEISELFNNLGKFVVIPTSSYFDDISKALCEHASRRWNKAKASLKHNYFNTPWAIISFFAAAFLLILTVLQTIFTAISTFPSS